MGLSDRKKAILKVVIDEYIDTAEPVGSKAIAEKSGLNVSSATIRNEMAELEEMGYLEQPHTSAGRIPSPSGYRVYVDALMRRHRLTLEETDTINESLKSRVQQLEDLIAEAGRAVSQLTNYPAFALAAPRARVTVTRYDFIFVDEHSFIVLLMTNTSVVKNKLMHFPVKIEEGFVKKLSTVFNARFTDLPAEELSQTLIISSEQSMSDELGLVTAICGFVIQTLNELEDNSAYLAGVSHLLEQPEYRDVDKAHRLLRYLSDSNELKKLPSPGGDKDLSIMIGPENVATELQDSSVVMARYDLGDNMQGLIGVVGPTRMDYAKIAAKLGYFAESMTRLMNGEGQPPAVPPHSPDDG